MVFRVLCFHGFKQTAGSFRGRLGSLRRSLKKLAELRFMDGPVVLPPFEQEKEDGSVVTYSDCRSWWKASEDGSTYEGLDETMEAVIQFMLDEGPFDGILGFSQGSAMVLLIAGLRERLLRQGGQEDHPFRRLRFALSVGGFVPRARSVQYLFQEDNVPLSLPCLIILGDTDQIVTPEVTLKTEPLFADAAVHRHPGAHILPTSRTDIIKYWEFLLRFWPPGENKEALLADLERKRSEEEKEGEGSSGDEGASSSSATKK